MLCCPTRSIEYAHSVQPLDLTELLQDSIKNIL